MSQLQQLTSKTNDLIAFEGKNKHTWCSGCGNFGIFNGIKRALTLENIKPHEVLLCFDVGCNGNGSDKINANTIHGLHGRVIPLASGAEIANDDLEIIAMAGDGATFSEGINHLVHGIRNNYNITFLCHNNNNYGLTIGQASSTTKTGYSMNATPDGVITEPINTLQFILSLNPSFVARSFSGDVDHITKMIQAGLNHDGFAYIEIMQACPTFNKATPQEWYWDKIKYLDSSNHDKNDIWIARKAVDNIETEIGIGIIYENKSKTNWKSNLNSRKNHTSSLSKEVKTQDITRLLHSFI